MAEVIKPRLSCEEGWWSGLEDRWTNVFSVLWGGGAGVGVGGSYLVSVTSWAFSVQVLWISRPLGIHRKRLMAERAGGHSQVWGDHTGSRVCNHEL